MFPYDPPILAAVQNPPRTIPNVLHGLQTIDGLCVEEDALKWFNGLYLTVDPDGPEPCAPPLRPSAIHRLAVK
jgi:hypothetical protein